MTFEMKDPICEAHATQVETDGEIPMDSDHSGPVAFRWPISRAFVEMSNPKLATGFTDDVLDRAHALVSLSRGTEVVAAKDIDVEFAGHLAHVLSFLSGNGIVSAATLEMDAYLPHLIALFATYGGRMSGEDQTERAREWFWCAALSGAYEALGENDHYEIAPMAATWIIDEEVEPSFMLDFRLLRSALTHEQGLKLKRFGKAAIAAVAASGAQDALSGMALIGADWKTVPIFDVGECGGEGWTADQADGPVNRVAVTHATAKIIGTSLCSYVESIGSIDDLGEMVKWQGIDPQALRDRRTADVFRDRGEWIVRSVDRLVGYRLERALTLDDAKLTPDVWMFSRGAVGLGVRGANNTIVVLAGSTMSPDNNPTQRARNTALRERLVAEGVVVDGPNGFGVFATPYQFVSLSAAASVLSGRNSAAYKWEEFQADSIEARLADLERRRTRWQVKTRKLVGTEDSAHEIVDDELGDDEEEMDLASAIFDFDDDEMECEVSEETNDEVDIAGMLFNL
jgi:hypothetical protein